MATHVLTRWDPEDQRFWESEGKTVATRNLWISIPALTLAFVVWMVWSVVVVNLPNVGFKFNTNQLFWLAAIPGLSGATLRIFYSFMVPIFGGRLWTTLSTLSLAIPAYWMGIAVQDPNTSYVTFLIIALLCGFGGGNFASSMANISFFYPKAQQGTALGLNAGLGNLGVSVMQRMEDYGDHAEGRAVADARGQEQQHEHGEEAPEVAAGRPRRQEVQDAAHGQRHDHEVPVGDARTAELVGYPATDRPDQGADHGAQEGVLGGVDRRELGLDQQREARRVADERAEGADVEPAHDPVVPALEDDRLVGE